MVMHPFRFVRSAATAAALALTFGSGYSAIAPLAASVPPPQGPSERTIHVATEADLQTAVAAVASHTTIVLAPGTYLLTRTLAISGSLTGVVLRGASANPDDVVLVGRGMTDRNYGAVPHGILVSGNVQGITIANLTIRDVFQHAIVLNARTQRPVIHNVRLLNAGQQFIKANSNGSGGGVDDGVVEYSTIEYTTTARDGSTSGIEVLGGSGWLVRGNLFRNIKAPSGQLAGPAVLMWHGSRDSIVEGNTFLNSQREIAFGLEDRKGHDHSGGIIRNNFVYREPGIQGDAAIHIGDSPDTQVLHNTILASGTFLSLIEYRFPGTRDVVIRNNLLDGQIVARNGAKAAVAGNYTSASPEMFVNAAAGDLHLVGTAVAVIDAAEPLPNVTSDWDGERRPHGAAADYGADEFVGTPQGPIGSQSSTLPLTSDSSTGGSGTTVTSSASSLTAALPSPWQSADIGNPLREGNASYASGTFTVQGAGTDIAGNADQFRFVYQLLEGDGEIVARVASLERTQPWAKAGVMIRDELTPGAKYASALVTAEKGVYFQYRIANGAMTSPIAGGSGKAPYWVKLTRKGNVFTAFGSKDGSSWTTMGSETVNIGRLAYVGLAVTSKAHRNLTTATFTGVAVSPGTSGPVDQAPIVSLTSPSDGSTYSAPATLALSAAATDSDGTVTRVDFFAGSTLIGSSSRAPYGLTWSNVPAGKHALKAVAHDDAGKSSASPVVEVTVVENKPPSVSLTAPASNATFTAPATVTLSATASDSDGTVAGIEFYAGTTLIGIDTSNPYSVTWSNVAAGSYTLTAVARDDAGASSTSMPVAITVTAPANRPPTVSLTSPSAGATYVAPASITLSANASDPDGTISKVDFFAGNVLIGSDSTSPYSGTWSNVPAGSYTFTAVAHDDSGASTTSAPVAITVTSSSPLPRHVVFTASADHATNVTSYAVEIFQAGANPATTAPFRTQNAGKPTPVNGDITVDVSATVQALPSGTYFFTVSATGAGGTSRSAPTETFSR